MNASLEAPRQLKQFEQHLQNKQWDAALKLIHELQEQHGSRLLETAPGQYCSLADVCQQRIAEAPRELLNLYRQKIDVLSKSTWQRALDSRKERTLVRICRTNFCSAHAETALKILAEMAIERGELKTAEDYYHLLRRPPHNLSTEQTEIPDSLLPPLQTSLPTPKSRLTFLWRRSLPFPGSPQAAPAVDRNYLYLNRTGAIYGFQLGSGEPPFAGMNSVDPVIYQLPLVKQRVAGNSVLSADVSQGNLYAQLKSSEGNGSVICLDLERAEGKLKWKIPSTLNKGKIRFQGTPLVVGKFVFLIAVEGSSTKTVSLCCLETLRGRLLWTSEIGSLLNDPFSKMSPKQSSRLIQSGPSILVFFSDQMIAELDAFTGTVRRVEDLGIDSQSRDTKISLSTEGNLLMQNGQELSSRKPFQTEPDWTITLPESGELISGCGTSHGSSRGSEIVLRYDDRLEWLDPKSGKIRYKVSLPLEMRAHTENKNGGVFWLTDQTLIYFTEREISLYQAE